MKKHGSGTVYQRKDGKKLWVAQIMLNAQRLSESFTSQIDAENWLKKMGAFITSAEDVLNVITLKSYLETWLLSREPGLDTKKGTPEAVLRQRLEDFDEAKIKDTTFSTYRCIMNKHIIPCIDEKLLLVSTSSKEIKEILKTARNDSVGARTRQVMRNILHKALEDAVVLGLIANNPIVGIKVTYEVPSRGILTVSKAKRLIDIAKGTRYHNLIIIALISGCRMGELLGLKWDDVDFEGQTIYVNKQIQRIQRRDNGTILAFTEPKTKSSKRPITLGENAIKILNAQIKLLLAEKKLAGKRWKETDLVFPSSLGTPLEQTTLRRAYKRLLIKAEIDPSIHFHDLRHTSISATRSSKVGADVATTMKRSGHSQTRTLDRYTHQMGDEGDFGVADRLDDLFIGDLGDEPSE